MNVDVVIPTFNRFWAIRRVVPSYLSHPEVHRVIVVDDGSSDGTNEWLEKMKIAEPRLLVLRHDGRRGACAARNTGAEKAQAPYIFFADDDMLIAPEKAFKVLIDDLVEADADIIAPFLIFQENEQPKRQLLGKNPPPDLLYLYHRLTLERKSMEKLHDCIPESSFESAQLPGLMLMHLHVLDKVRYDEQLGDNSYRDETDFQLKAIEHGFRLLACPKVYLIDLFRPNDKGGCHITNPIKYELLCCRNNWRVLRRHRSILKRIGIRIPIHIMQLLFITMHIFNRLPRSLIFELRQKLGFIR